MAGKRKTAIASRTKQPGDANATPEQIEIGLAEWIATGSSRRAAEKCGMSESTVRKWKQTQADRFRELSHAFEAETAEMRPARARSAADAVAMGVLAIRQKLAHADTLEARDVAALTGAAVRAADSYDHAGRLAAGMPSEIVEFRTEDLDAELTAMAAQYERKGARS